MFYQMHGSLSVDAALHCVLTNKNGKPFTSKLLAEATLIKSLLEDKAGGSFALFFTDFLKEPMTIY